MFNCKSLLVLFNLSLHNMCKAKSHGFVVVNVVRFIYQNKVILCVKIEVVYSHTFNKWEKLYVTNYFNTCMSINSL